MVSRVTDAALSNVGESRCERGWSAQIMSGIAIVVLLVIGVPLLAFAVWQLLQEGLVRIESGSVGLLIVRGKASDRILMPGAHFIWPFRHQMIQGYPMRELTYLTADDGGVEETDFSDPPLMARLGDRAAVSVYYTIRFRILPDSLRGLHERVGPDGLKPLVRDQSRRDIIQELASDVYGIDDAFGAARDQLEAKLAARVTESLQADGFEVGMFNLRGIDLGAVNEAVVATVRAKAGLELEKADARVRKLRVDNEAKTTAQLASSLTDAVLRYRQIELGREALQRWDGRIVIGDAALARAVAAETTGAAEQSTTDVEPVAEADTSAAPQVDGP
jgi:regulator of protease activity HflC (stomatin/prohibitin superfamily)